MTNNDENKFTTRQFPRIPLENIFGLPNYFLRKVQLRLCRLESERQLARSNSVAEHLPPNRVKRCMPPPQNPLNFPQDADHGDVPVQETASDRNQL